MDNLNEERFSITKNRLIEKSEHLEFSLYQNSIVEDITSEFIAEVRILVMDLLNSLENKAISSNEAIDENLNNSLIQTAAICDAIIRYDREKDLISYFSTIRSHLHPQLQSVTFLLG